MKLPTAAAALSAILLAPAVTGKCDRHSRAYCNGTTYNSTLIHRYVCGDPRLGPIRLPERLPLDSVFDIYDRFGGLCPGEFLDAWWNNTAGRYNYPDGDGFSFDNNQQPIVGNYTLTPGVLIDRFGDEGGIYVSPAAAPYLQRSLPPSKLDAPQDQWPYFPYNYHVYRVLKPLVVRSGPIDPWFGQPGQGVQYVMNDNITILLSQGSLKGVNPRTLLSY